MGSNRLTIHQEEVYNFVKDFIQRNKFSPYLREIQVACGINSHKNVIDRLNALEKKGYIKRKLNKHRNIKLVHKQGMIAR